ncbi:MAG: hypothetical protein Q9163_002326 [Psora crenata]
MTRFAVPGSKLPRFPFNPCGEKELSADRGRSRSSFYHVSSEFGVILDYCISLFNTPLTNVYSTSTFADGSLPNNPRLITVDPKSVSYNTVYADIIEVQWQDTDQDIIELMSQKEAQEVQARTSSASKTATPASQTTTVGAASSSAPFPSTNAVATATPEPSPSGGLSTGSKAGVGVAVPLGVLAIAIGLAAFLALRRRKRRKNKYTHHPPGVPGGPEYSELEQSKMTQSPPIEMDGTEVGTPRGEVGEVDGTEVGEMPGTSMPAELSREMSIRSRTETSTMMNPAPEISLQKGT